MSTKEKFFVIAIIIAGLLLFAGAVYLNVSSSMDKAKYIRLEMTTAMDKLISAGLVEHWITADNITHIGLTTDGRQYELEVKTSY